jgi:hypothetical protein
VPLSVVIHTSRYRVGGPARSGIRVLPEPRVAVPTRVVCSSRALGDVAVRISSTVPGLGDTTVTEATAIGIWKLSITPSPFL